MDFPQTGLGCRHNNGDGKGVRVRPALVLHLIGDVGASGVHLRSVWRGGGLGAPLLRPELVKSTLRFFGQTAFLPLVLLLKREHEGGFSSVGNVDENRPTSSAVPLSLSCSTHRWRIGTWPMLSQRERPSFPQDNHTLEHEKDQIHVYIKHLQPVPLRNILTGSVLF